MASDGSFELSRGQVTSVRGSAWSRPKTTTPLRPTNQKPTDDVEAGTRGAIVVSHTMYYACLMADTITFRPDEQARRAIEALTEDGTPVSTVVRDALVAAAKARARARMREEARALANDPEEQAEIARIQKDMEPLRAW
jgi:hypothetical protein